MLLAFHDNLPVRFRRLNLFFESLDSLAVLSMAIFGSDTLMTLLCGRTFTRIIFSFEIASDDAFLHDVTLRLENILRRDAEGDLERRIYRDVMGLAAQQRVKIRGCLIADQG